MLAVINKQGFRQHFVNNGNGNVFTPNGLDALFDFYNISYTSRGRTFILDVLKVCQEWEELSYLDYIHKWLSKAVTDRLLKEFYTTPNTQPANLEEDKAYLIYLSVVVKEIIHNMDNDICLITASTVMRKKDK